MKWYEIVILILCGLLVYYFLFSGNSTVPYIGLAASQFRGSPRFKEKKEKSKGEGKCRQVLQTIYGKHFPSTRPYFLKSPETGKNLELDCYNPDLKIAVEYHGQQHYKHIPHFHKTENDFINQQRRDQWKKKTCEDLGICYIEVPYTVKLHEIYNYIYTELKMRGKLPKEY